MGTSSTTYAKTPMAIKMTYWNAMKIHIELAKLVSKIFIVKQSIPALVMTEATAVICKIDSHVPISCAPTGMVRLNVILSHSTVQCWHNKYSHLIMYTNLLPSDLISIKLLKYASRGAWKYRNIESSHGNFTYLEDLQLDMLRQIE